ncbi:helix-turn-helix domain-containing protein [Bacillus sp. SCS-151]|uniref:helix-turn-helix domain-containing protein n=1 Tax=Nanhaiella sioensis TaxID=3115293 RepID=UPI003978B366
MNLLEVGATIKKHRKRKGINSKKLSVSIGKSDSYVSHLENGRNKNPDYKTLEKILEIIEVPKVEREGILRVIELRESKPAIKQKKIKTGYINQTTYYLFQKQITEDAESIARELEDLNIETKQILIELLQGQVNTQQVVK